MTVKTKAPDVTRRKFMKQTAATAAVGAGSAILGAPFISNASAAQTTTWRIQTF